MILDIMMTLVGILLIVLLSVVLISGILIVTHMTVTIVFGIEPEQQWKHVKDWFARRRGGSDDS